MRHRPLLALTSPIGNLVTNIATDYMQQSRPHLLMGGYRIGALEPAVAAGAGYTVVTDRSEMNALNPNGADPVAGLFTVGQMPYEFDGDFATVPDLSEMTVKALDIMDADPGWFFSAS